MSVTRCCQPGVHAESSTDRDGGAGTQPLNGRLAEQAIHMPLGRMQEPIYLGFGGTESHTHPFATSFGSLDSLCLLSLVPGAAQGRFCWG